MKIELDPNSGFCFGVTNAIKMAEDILGDNETLFCLGDIVHNNVEVNRLKDLGLISINHEEYAKLHDTSVLIRAHGEPPSTYEIAKKQNIQLIDATCPVVLRLQDKIERLGKQIFSNGGQVVIYGKHGHAEVVGLIGQTGGKAIVVMDENDLKKVDFNQPIHLFSQTTRKIKDYQEIAAVIRNKMKNPEYLSIHNSICPSVSGREPELKEFAKNHDIIIFVSGEKSSNGKMLFKVCKEANSNAYFVSKPDDINATWFTNMNSVGISGATSTPWWLMEQVAETIKNIKL
ncbi:MAG: 4-hydroxy-3-methylbut-2-enyl diphosphate reductase [Bacteroidales bacterium]|jgi:4-hydroxy-3-methylbut-2-enyl diphosphate reductase|nr:4-hydroxy-3-methylbut-2-enyl diphosphate reductase [Bacteroidales bacterium]